MSGVKRTILRAVLIVVMVMGGGEVVFAAQPSDAATEISDIAVDDLNMDKAASDAVIESLEVEYRGESSSGISHIFIRAEGTGCKVDIYINGKLFMTKNGGDYFPLSIDYPAPATTINEHFYDCLYGGTYKIEIVPYLYTKNGPVARPGISKTITVPQIPDDGFSSWIWAGTSSKGNGYNILKSVHISWQWVKDAYIRDALFEIQRKEGTGAWQTIATMKREGFSSYDFYDYKVSLGKKYQYRVRFAGGGNDYVQAVPPGKWFYIKEGLDVSATDAWMYLSYDGEGVNIDISCRDHDFCSGFEIYRSTKKTKGYKKIAKIADNTYTDKKVKSGTYYYKVRSYYYDEITGKTYYGNFSEPKMVKPVLGNICAEVKQTGKSQATLTWNKIKGISDYEVWYKSGIKGDVYKLYKKTTGTKLKVSGLLNNTQYYFTVRAKKSGSAYYTSGDCNCFIGIQEPAPYISKKKVALNKAKTQATIKSTIKWDRIYGAKKIYIVGGMKGTYSTGYVPTEKVIKTLKGTATSYTLTTKITSLDDGYDYIKIVAVNGKKEKESERLYWVYKGLDDTEKLTVKRAGNAGCVISWKAVQGAVTYDVYRQTPKGNYMCIGVTDKCTFKDLNVTPGVKYTYYIRANNSLVEYHDQTTFTTYIHKLGTPKIKSIKNSRAKTVTIKWNKIKYASGYTIYRATGRNGKYKKIAVIKNGKTTYTDKRLKKGKTYYYKVRATGKNAAGLNVSSAVSKKKAVKVKK